MQIIWFIKAGGYKEMKCKYYTFQRYCCPHNDRCVSGSFWLVEPSHCFVLCFLHSHTRHLCYMFEVNLIVNPGAAASVLCTLSQSARLRASCDTAVAGTQLWRTYAYMLYQCCSISTLEPLFIPHCDLVTDRALQLTLLFWIIETRFERDICDTLGK